MKIAELSFAGNLGRSSHGEGTGVINDQAIDYAIIRYNGKIQTLKGHGPAVEESTAEAAAEMLQERGT